MMKLMATFFVFTMFVNANAQEITVTKEKQHFTPEQQAELQTKKMELDLGFSEKQGREIYILNLEMAQKRKQNAAEFQTRKAENKKLTSDEKYQKELNRLEDQKKYQTELKRILGDEKYSVWKENQQNKRENHQRAIQKNRANKRTHKTAPTIN